MTYISVFWLAAGLRVAFSLFDKDGDGAITASELSRVMDLLGYKSDSELVKRMIGQFDEDGRGLRCHHEVMSIALYCSNISQGVKL